VGVFSEWRYRSGWTDWAVGCCAARGWNLLDGRFVSVVWDGYVPFDPGVSGPLQDVARREAREAFERLMSEKATRIQMLRSLLQTNGVVLEGSDEGVQELNDWFRENVEPSRLEPGRLGNLWYAVVNDIALFLGDVMIERAQGLRWEFFTGGKKDASFQRHVIAGFSRVPNPKYNVDIDAAVATYGQRVVADQAVNEDAFLQWIENAVQKA
jgi:hypothetical protein